MAGVIQEIDLLITEISKMKAVKDAGATGQQIGQEMGRALAQTPAVKDATAKLGQAITSEISKATGRAKMDMALLATASGQIRQAVHPVAAAMSAAAQATTAVGATSAKASPLVNSMRSALTNLASQAAGVPGPLGRVASLLLQFTGGGGLALGVVAGIGLIVLAWNRLTAATRKAHEETKKYVESQRQLNLAGTSAHGRFTAEMVERERQVAALKEEFAQEQNRMRASGAPVGQLSNRQKEILAALIELQRTYNRLTRDWAKLETDAVNDFEESVERAGIKVAKVTSDIASAGGLNDQIIGQGAEAAADATRIAGELTSEVIADLTEQWKAQNTERLADTQTALTAEQQAIQDIEAANLDFHNMLVQWDEEDRARRQAEQVERLAHLEEMAFRIEGIIDNTMGIASAWGLVSDAMAESLSSLGRLATDAAGFAKALAGGDVLGVISAGINVIGDIGGVIGIKRNKDPGRLRTNEELFDRAIQGDTAALNQLEALSKEWATDKAKQDARQKWEAAKRILETEFAPERARIATEEANRAAEEAARVAEQAERERISGVRGGEEAQVAHRAEVERAEHVRGLLAAGGPAELATRLRELEAEFNRLVTTSELGFDSPLARDARRRADEAARELEQAIDAAKRDEGKLGEGVTPGFTVQRTITESSAGRVIGELTTHSVLLTQIRDLIAGGKPVGVPDGNGVLHIENVVMLDGEVVTRNVSRRQADAFQRRAGLNGNSEMSA
jgi:hypothetical protein